MEIDKNSEESKPTVKKKTRSASGAAARKAPRKRPQPRDAATAPADAKQVDIGAVSVEASSAAPAARKTPKGRGVVPAQRVRKKQAAAKPADVRQEVVPVIAAQAPVEKKTDPRPRASEPAALDQVKAPALIKDAESNTHSSSTEESTDGRRGARRGRRGRRGRGGRHGQAEDRPVINQPVVRSPDRPKPAPVAPLGDRNQPTEDWDEDWSRQAEDAVAAIEYDEFDSRMTADGDPSEFVEDEPDRDVDVERPASSGERLMLINVSGGIECRVAVLENGRLEELFLERASAQSHVGNIYKGKVTNVEPGIQAVFIDFGLKKNGFLHISDVQPQYFPDHRGEAEEVGRKIPRHLRPPIQRCFRRGQEVIVQVTKEGVGTKGPTLTTYLSIPGRYLVMMPGMNRHGVSRKIEDDVQRRRMRDVMNELSLPSGMGFILRTAGVDRNKRDLQRDLNYLMRLWRTVADRVRALSSPAELYQESDLLTRAIRDIYTTDFEKIIVDDPETAKRAQEFLQIANPRARTNVDLYASREPLFHKFGVEAEIDRINARHVPLQSGGTLVIDSTEALVAIDVNSGKFRALDDAEETAYRINIEAAEEIARQLRLRDLGGLILCDFIDMRMDRHKRAVEKALRDALKKHKERARILKMSAFGIIEMTRQRQGPSIKRNIYYDCPHCKGSGLVKMPESVVLDVMRTIQLAAHHEQVQKVTITVSTDVVYQILNEKRVELSQVEAETGKSVIVNGNPGYTSDQVDYFCEDAQGLPVLIAPTTRTPSLHRTGGSERAVS